MQTKNYSIKSEGIKLIYDKEITGEDEENTQFERIELCHSKIGIRSVWVARRSYTKNYTTDRLSIFAGR